MKSAENKSCSVELEAPDPCIAGLLCILCAESMHLEEEKLYTFAERQGCWYLFALEEGNVQMTHDGQHVNLRSGNAVVFSGNGNTTLLPSEGGSLLMVCVQGKAADELLLESRKRGGLFFSMGGASAATMFGELKAKERRDGRVSCVAASAAAYQMLAKLYGTGLPFGESRKQMPAVVINAIRMMQQDFAFFDGTAEIADRLEVSQEYFTRVFRKYVGLPPGKYLTQLKIEYAKLLLRQGKHTVSFVADACGFANGNYFARVFRKSVGLSPAEYMHNHMEQNVIEDPMLDPFYVL